MSPVATNDYFQVLGMVIFLLLTSQIFCFCRHMWRQLAHLCSDRLTIIQIEIRTLHLKNNATEILILHLAVVILCD